MERKNARTQERKNKRTAIFDMHGEDMMYSPRCDCQGTSYQEDCCGIEPGTITDNLGVDYCIDQFVKNLSAAKDYESYIEAVNMFRTSLPLNIELDFKYPSSLDFASCSRYIIYETRPETDKEMETRKKRTLKNLAKKKKQLEKLRAEVEALEV